MTWKRKSNIDRVEIVEVIRVDSIVGKGTEDDPVRRLVEFWSMDGKLLARDDSLAAAGGVGEEARTHADAA